MRFDVPAWTAFRLAACLLAAVAAPAALAQPCPPARQMKAEHLFGLWAVRYANPPAGLPERATLLLERHAEFSESLAGLVQRDLTAPAAAAIPSRLAPQAELAGDLDEGMLLLDESSDRVRITATWNGEMLEGSCGTVFHGEWKDTSADDAPAIAFTLTKLP